MVGARRGNRLERWEVSLVKAMIARSQLNDQEILAYFTRPIRTINHARIGEIRTGARHAAVTPASQQELDEFLRSWPQVDAETGLSLRGDELLVKAREAMIAAVHTFNGAGLHFRAELFIVTAIVAWTYLLHAWFRREGIDYRYRDSYGSTSNTKNGAERYWDLARCLKHQRCPLSPGVATNLRFLIELRHEIEHRSTGRIDDTISAKLQACCINFNEATTKLFGPRVGLDRRLPIALQFGTFGSDQRSELKQARDLPANISSQIDSFEASLSADEYKDPAYRYRVAFVPVVRNRVSSADTAVEFVKADSVEAQEVSRILLKEVERPRYTATEVCQKMQAEGFTKFNQHAHTRLWQQMAAKDPSKGFGRPGDYKGTWVWFENWVERVRAHCREQGDRYK